MVSTQEETYLGFDLSTQKLKAVQLNSNLKTIAYAEVKFDNDLPEFNTSGGVNTGDHKDEFFAQPVMWVKALDMVLDRLVVQGANLNTVAGISGSAQQHGSVYWTQEGVETLKSLDADKFLHIQVDNSAFSVTHCPIWMDGSTRKQCLELEEGVGGQDKMVTISGSKCYSRFTGPQIRKIFETKRDAYERTQRISLVSSFLASLFLGDVAPIDYADGSGMNLLDIRKKDWSLECLDACAPHLKARLGKPTHTCSIIGNISTYFVHRYGFSSNCKITAFTGDNPSALTGMLVGKDWLAMSLGTSDTIMVELSEPKKLHDGHVLCHPTESGFMILLWNGSLVRNEIKRAEANNSWKHFNELLDSTPLGNNGNMALHFHTLEIIPKAKGILKWDKFSKNVDRFESPKDEVRALIEGQMLQRKAVTNEIGFTFGPNTKILATGGASINKSILQVISDVFNAPVYIQKTTEAALYGAAFRVKYNLYLNSVKGSGTQEGYHKYMMMQLSNHLEKICEPHKDSQKIYTPMLDRYREMVKTMEAH